MRPFPVVDELPWKLSVIVALTGVCAVPAVRVVLSGGPARAVRRVRPDEDPPAWLDDPAHPNAVGHLEMADHTLRTLGLGPVTPL